METQDSQLAWAALAALGAVGSAVAAAISAWMAGGAERRSAQAARAAEERERARLRAQVDLRREALLERLRRLDAEITAVHAASGGRGGTREQLLHAAVENARTDVAACAPGSDASLVDLDRMVATLQVREEWAERTGGENESTREAINRMRAP